MGTHNKIPYTVFTYKSNQYSKKNFKKYKNNILTNYF